MFILSLLAYTVGVVSKIRNGTQSQHQEQAQPESSHHSEPI
jgi:hypothetical protein